MHLEVKIVKQTVLHLEDEEARWLKAVMQNPLGDAGESLEDAEMRTKFFNALNTEVETEVHGDDPMISKCKRPV